MSKDKKSLDYSASIPSMQKVASKEGQAAASADVTKFQLAPGTPPAKKSKK